jgi:hypothetical protein
MISTLLLALALGAETPAPSPVEIERMNHTFARARQVWVVTTGKDFYVTRPRASELGLDYRRSTADPPRRPAIVAGNWDTFPAPARPLPWPAIQRIEWKRGGAGMGFLAGTLGAVAILGIAVGQIVHENSVAAVSAPSILLGALGGGALIGVVAGSLSAKTVVIYRAPLGSNRVEPERDLSGPRAAREPAAGLAQQIQALELEQALLPP